MKILIYMTGSLGDTLTTIPALWAIRTHWPEAKLTLLSDAQMGESRVSPQSILAGAGLFDDFLNYPTSEYITSKWARLKTAFALWSILRREKPDVLIYLVRTFTGDARLKRDRLFFRLAGLEKVIGCEPLLTLPKLDSREKLTSLPRLADMHLQQIHSGGVPVPPEGAGRYDLGLNAAEHATLAKWKKKLRPDGGRRWVAFGVGSKMPSKIWPLERYEQLGALLIERFDIWPVIFGGSEDREAGETLISHWGRGLVVAGELDVRQSAAALAGCALYVGNDTGTMHLAASAGVRCVALFSARDYPGLWEPYGEGHQVLRREVPCAVCKAQVCPVPGHPCLMEISVGDVFVCCEKVLK